MTNPISPTFCRGFILAHQHPNQIENKNENEKKIDPYSVIPCPYNVKIPNKISENCKNSKNNKVCWKSKYCEMHWCGGCKKINKIGKAENKKDDNLNEHGIGNEMDKEKV
ncbi:uncharacterized protein I206_107074 [Kwoniella pini CBS 10737]|uniref:Uncharacterized protein n=1 Tax=Kwoniella pini CBS 10737 TaxID=1296096 RepID=A0A1B9HZ99_9TREE|nr:uncharacterized protein I206_05382 [Kwoniella pini CBS 10737]OCF48602.1 hypothetical protein I206_05382 [Kwoniella pini CBS 10737]